MFADLILHNASIYPQATDERIDNALAIHEGKIVGLGNQSQLEPLIGEQTALEDLGGRTVLPGLTDAHIHLAGLANSIAAIDCQTPDIEECLRRIKARAEATEEDAWLTGHGWDQNIWGAWPTRQVLDRVAPDQPVYLTARSLHAAVANTAALRRSGISSESPDPEDGAFQRTPEGELTGVLFEGAMRLVSDNIPSPSTALLADRIENAQQVLWRVGVTGVHDFDGADCFAALQKLHQQGRLGIRVLKHLRSNYLQQALDIGLRPNFGDDWLKLGNVKLFSDGALGPRTAAMIEPYDDEVESRGILLLEEEEIVETGLRAASAGFSLAIHAIGDRANKISLRAISRLNHELKNQQFVLPHRLEHLQLLRPEDLDRVGSSGVIASMQPIHAISDQQMAQRAWQSRNHYSYAWRRVLETGATLAFGSDAPVEDPNPFWGIHAAVTRKQRQPADEPAFYPDLSISLNQTLKAYTTGPALAAGWEGKLGSLTAGRYADLIVLPQDPHQMDPEDLFRLKPEATMVNGTWRYRNF